MPDGVRAFNPQWRFRPDITPKYVQRRKTLAERIAERWLGP